MSESIYSCNFCDKKYILERNLIKHLRKIHGKGLGTGVGSGRPARGGVIKRKKVTHLGEILNDLDNNFIPILHNLGELTADTVGHGFNPFDEALDRENRQIYIKPAARAVKQIIKKYQLAADPETTEVLDHYASGGAIAALAIPAAKFIVPIVATQLAKPVAKFVLNKVKKTQLYKKVFGGSLGQVQRDFGYQPYQPIPINPEYYGSGIMNNTGHYNEQPQYRF